MIFVQSQWAPSFERHTQTTFTQGSTPYDEQQVLHFRRPLCDTAMAGKAVLCLAAGSAKALRLAVSQSLGNTLSFTNEKIEV